MRDSRNDIPDQGSVHCMLLKWPWLRQKLMDNSDHLDHQTFSQFGPMQGGRTERATT